MKPFQLPTPSRLRLAVVSMGSLALAIIGTTALTAENPQTIEVGSQANPISIDGKLDDWTAPKWAKVNVKPAIKEDKKNLVGQRKVALMARLHGDSIYVAARWPDSAPDTKYRNWAWRGNKYRRGKELDDMFALRFEMSGDYDNCMLTQKEYTVDVWLWSAGRSDLSGHAEDLLHRISPNPIENAAEYEDDKGRIIYIKKTKDKGKKTYKNTRPKRKVFTTKTIVGVEPTSPSGSAADIKAKATWKDGFWTLEMARALNTNHADDIVLIRGHSIRGAIAVFNKSSSEHKSNSDTLLFKLAP